jgi:sugar phosphate isomerase/epimerase
MKLGFFTACLRNEPLADTITWAAATGFDTLEIACWPIDNTRDYSGSQLDVAQLSQSYADEVLELFAVQNMTISCLTYCDNNLDRDLEKREAHLQHLRKVIDAAAMLQVDTVCTFIGRDEYQPISENIKLAGRVLQPILDHAAEKNIRVCVENCPMPNWQYEGLVGNVAHSPDVWDGLFEALPYENFGLNLDPSHLHWLGINPAQAAREYGAKLFFAHAKDTEVMPDQVYRRGIMDPQHGGWWRYRMPGLGEIDFAAFMAALQEGGYTGPLSIEHEDPVWEGTPEKVKHGLKLGLEHLQKMGGNL